MTARELKDRLYARHPGSAGQMPGPWTCIEELHGIDLVAFSAWSSAGRYARVGYEVKVSRSDLRRELLRPSKRSRNVEWCNEFYFAVPAGLLSDAEIAFEEPAWQPQDFMRSPCPASALAWGDDDRCVRGKCIPHRHYRNDVDVPCSACLGKGYIDKSRVEREAPTVWVPDDVGLVVVNGRGTSVAKKSPRRKDVPAVDRMELGQIIRWVSMRPDPRHHPASARHVPEPTQIPLQGVA